MTARAGAERATFSDATSAAFQVKLNEAAVVANKVSLDQLNSEKRALQKKLVVPY